MPYKILLVEDEESLLDIIKLNLELEGYDVTSVSNGRVALNQIQSKHFDLVILDVMLPEMDGFSICQAVRLENNPVPILFLTAKNSSEDRVFGLKIGGDDYLSKPFNLEELLLRVQLLLKRNSGTTAKQENILKFGNCEVNFITYEIKEVNGKKHLITKREILLLKLLAERKNEVVSREEILEKIWGEDVITTPRSIDNYIVAFRKYFEHNPREPRYFHSIRGVGYRFTP
jgi:two-component system, OmpR family, alkaline phosphatase synthesis response regulator PhoP